MSNPIVHAAVISGVTAIITAIIARPARKTHRTVREIRDEFRNNGGSSAKDALDRIERNQQHLAGRFDQHLADSHASRELAQKEAIRMWEAISDVARVLRKAD